LYAALCKHLPFLHGGHQGSRAAADRSAPDFNIGIHPLNGSLSGDRSLTLTRSSRLTIRLDSDFISQVLPLAGKQILVGGQPLNVGVPEIRPLRPAARLYSRLVVIKGFMEPEPFLEAVRRQLEAMKVRGVPGLLKRQGLKSREGRSKAGEDRCPFIRRTLRIRDREIVGYAVEVAELDADDSIRVQEIGIGGRRKFGCGVFVRARG